MTIIELLRAEIRALEVKITEVQSECNHPKSVVDRKNSGSWNLVHCGLCDKGWVETR